MLKAWDLISTIALIILAVIVFACLPAGGCGAAAKTEIGAAAQAPRTQMVNDHAARGLEALLPSRLRIRN